MLAKQKKILEETTWTNPKSNRLASPSQSEEQAKIKSLQAELEKIQSKYHTQNTKDKQRINEQT
jgi:membrane protein insertase Oxa1/YidC/SpoIIIJ